MKARFAVVSAVSFWLYAASDLIKKALETSVHAKLIVGAVGGVSYSSADYAIEISICQKVLLIIGCAFAFLFIVDIIIGTSEKRKKLNKQD